MINIIITLMLMTNLSPSKIQFLSERQEVLNILQNHNKKHNCILNQIDINKINTIQFFPSNIRDNKVFGYPKVDDYGNISLFYNSNKHFSPLEIKLFIIHELLHTNKICGEDKYKTSLPICNLFGNRIYVSNDINQSLLNHLSKELN